MGGSAELVDLLLKGQNGSAETSSIRFYSGPNAYRSGVDQNGYIRRILKFFAGTHLVSG